MQNSIRARLNLIFIGLAVIPLLVVGSVLTKWSFDAQTQQALVLQGEVARRVEVEVTAFIQGIVSDLEMIVEVQELQKLDLAQQTQLLADLQVHSGIYDRVILLDQLGHEQIRLSRSGVMSETDLRDQSSQDFFRIPQQTGEVYYGSIDIDSANEPLMIIAMPFNNLRTGAVDGVLVIEARVKKIWELIRDIRLNAGESVYIVDDTGRVILHRDPSVVLRGTKFEVPDHGGIQAGLDSSRAVLAVDQFRLGDQEFAIIAERNLTDALREGFNIVIFVSVVLAVTLFLAILLGRWVIHQMVRPIQALVAVSEAIEIGDFSRRAQVFRADELGRLAETFNRMADQLGQFISSLEQQVSARTRRLKLAATFSQNLGRILDVPQLLAELVERLEEIGYYHAHIYLLDEAGLNLIVAAGTGEVGTKLKAQSHSIELSAVASMVAKAARTGQVVLVDDVRKSTNWLPNPYLPETQAEIAVPIIANDQVVGVLDVQESRIAGLDDADADLLQFLAQQVAIALQNAELFSKTQAALEEAKAVHQRYLAKGWQTFLQSRPVTSAATQQQVLSPQAEALLQDFKQQALQDGSLIQQMVPTETDAADIEPQTAMIAPLKLRGQAIGTLGIQRAADRVDWSREEIALVEAIAEQVAVALENARLFSESQRRAAREETIANLTQAVWAGDSIESVLQQSVTKLGQTLHADKVILRLVPNHKPSEKTDRLPNKTETNP